MKIRCLVCVLCSSWSVASARPQQFLQQVHGASLDHLGHAMIYAGDTNNDGYDDLLVGAPDPNDGTPGTILCLSGKFLGTGIGPSSLWGLTPAKGGHFGASLAAVATLTGDSTTDFVVGAPNYVPTGTNSVTGAVMLVDGATHTVAATIYGVPTTHLGYAMVAVGDQDGDGKIDIAVSAIDDQTTDLSWVHIIPGSSFNGTQALTAVPHSSINSNGDHSWGMALASGFEFDSDSRFELAIGAPLMFGGAGAVSVMRPHDFSPFGGYVGSQPGERAGASISAREDFNGDGVADLVVGAPNWTPGIPGNTEDGRVVVVDGSDLATFQAPTILYTLTNSSGPAPATAHFGAAVCSSRDLNNDGVGDILVGAPDYRPTFPVGQPVKGAVMVYSGKTGVKVGALVGNNNDRLGDALVGGFDNLDGDAFLDFAVAASTSDSPYTDCGQVRGVRLFPTPAFGYCTGKTNSLGCVPLMGVSGSSSASSPSPFQVMCVNVLNQKSGMLLYAHAPAANPFQGGTLCVKPPTVRTPQQNSGGNTSGADCSGIFSFDFNARIQSGVDPTLVVGAEIFTQYWSRDPQSPSSTSLSTAVRFLVNP